jgi:D-alanyl-D-alanine carboxypeptidase/D-alanyl-D-alanine-endopeptidase (penicillin-binding protein 4)
MKESNTFAQFFGSLPQPGGPGTLKNVLSYVEEKEEKERLHAKSGSLSSVKCYAGYVVKGKETYTFAILTNNYSSRTAVMMEGIEGLMEELIR